jgi:hypothetical protein
VAERVSDERCEPSPGSESSLVGYQVRLDSARYQLFFPVLTNKFILLVVLCTHAAHHQCFFILVKCSLKLISTSIFVDKYFLLQ